MGTQASQPAVSAKWKGRRQFLSQFIEKPFMIGAVAPSSPRLAREMIRGLDLGSAQAVLEFGPGTGAFTDAILPRLGPRTKFIAIELNAGLAEAFRKRHPGVNLVNDSVEKVRRICDQAGIDRVDYIVSGLPWASFPHDLQDRVLDAIGQVLRPGGTLVTFGYHIGTLLPAGKRFYKELPKRFAKVERSGIIWANVPPAFLYRCTSAPAPRTPAPVTQAPRADAR